jgi:hypothetical protein
VNARRLGEVGERGGVDRGHHIKEGGELRNSESNGSNSSTSTFLRHYYIFRTISVWIANRICAIEFLHNAASRLAVKLS